MSLRIVGVSNRLSALAAIVLIAGCSEEATTGADGKTWLTAVTPAATGCTNGGVTVAVGPDENGNDVLDAGEVKSTALVCNGDDGSDGADGDAGAPGADGDRWVVATAEVGLDVCAWGGTIIRVGKDLDGGGALDTPEVLSTQTLCNPSVQATGVVFVWSGAGANDLWSNPANWEGNSAPRPGDTLSFPPSAARKRNQNDFPNHTAFDAILVEGTYELYGKKPIVLRLIDAKDDVVLEMPVAFIGPTNVTSRDNLVFTNTIDGTGELSVYGSGQVELATARVKSLIASDALRLNGDLTVGAGGLFGPLAGSGNIIKTGEGPFTLAISGTYPGTVFVQQGRILTSSALPNANVVVSAGARLEGSTTINSLAGAPGAVIEPNGTPGNMIFVNGLVLGGATYELDITGSSAVGFDTLRSVTTADVTGSTLAVTMTYAPTIGDSYTPVTGLTGLTGTFANLPDNGTLLVGSVLLRATYTPTQLVLTVEAI